MGWSFALINGRLAEIFFEREDDEKEPKMQGHCYVSADEYTTKREKKYIEQDTKKYQFSYRKGVYRDKIRNKVLQNAPLNKDEGVPAKDLITLLKQLDAES